MEAPSRTSRAKLASTSERGRKPLSTNAEWDKQQPLGESAERDKQGEAPFRGERGGSPWAQAPSGKNWGG